LFIETLRFASFIKEASDVHRDGAKKDTGRIKLAMPQTRGGMCQRLVPLAESAADAWESFARIAFKSAGVVTALSDL